MTFLLVGIAALALLLLWLRWMEPRMLYYPMREIEATPAERGWAYEDLRLRAADGVELRAWFVPAPEGARERPLTVLLLHGNAGNRSHRLEKLAVLRGLGLDALIVDYRGYGGSQGRPDEPGTYRDARAAYLHLTRDRGVAPRDIVLYGESLGSAVAVQLASEATVGAVVLEEAFTSVVDVARAMFPFLPVGLVVRNRYDALARIGRIDAPVMLLHSRDDEYFPFAHAERLAARARRATVVELRGGHNDAFLVSADVYRRALADFLSGLLRGGGDG